MISRFLLLIAILTSLLAGPVVPGSAWARFGAMVERCDCCMATVEPTCCSLPTTPTHQPPVSSTNASKEQLKLVPQPLVALLPACLVVNPPVVRSPVQEAGTAPVSSVIDRICIRLI